MTVKAMICTRVGETGRQKLYISLLSTSCQAKSMGWYKGVGKQSSKTPEREKGKAKGLVLLESETMAPTPTWSGHGRMEKTMPSSLPTSLCDMVEIMIFHLQVATKSRQSNPTAKAVGRQANLGEGRCEQQKIQSTSENKGVSMGRG